MCEIYDTQNLKTMTPLNCLFRTSTELQQSLCWVLWVLNLFTFKWNFLTLAHFFGLILACIWKKNCPKSLQASQVLMYHCVISVLWKVQTLIERKPLKWDSRQWRQWLRTKSDRQRQMRKSRTSRRAQVQELTPCLG